MGNRRPHPWQEAGDYLDALNPKSCEVLAGDELRPFGPGLATAKYRVSAWRLLCHKDHKALNTGTLGGYGMQAPTGAQGEHAPACCKVPGASPASLACWRGTRPAPGRYSAIPQGGHASVEGKGSHEIPILAIRDSIECPGLGAYYAFSEDETLSTQALPAARSLNL